MALLDLDRLFRCLTVLLLLPLAACGEQENKDLSAASRNYKQHRDSQSLEHISRHLYAGMLRVEVEGLLGEADYSPIEGQYYYASTWNAVQQNTSAPTLVVDYRDAEGEPTARLHVFWLGLVGE